jgi:cell division protein FtsL
MTGTELLWVLYAAITVVFILGFLRAIGSEYSQAVRRHNLQIEVNHLRLEQKRQIAAIAAAQFEEDVEIIEVAPAAEQVMAA